MVKTFKKTILAVVVLVLFVTNFNVSGTFAGTTNGIQDKINKVLAVYPTGSYFTVASSSAGCKSANHDIFDGNWCMGCYLPSIPARGGLPSGSQVGYTADTCCGFANYVYYCIYGHNIANNTTTKSSGPVFGDLVYTGSHWFIYLSENSSNYYVYDANGYNSNGKNRICYNNTYPKSAVSSLTIYHANNYDAIKGSSSAKVTTASKTQNEAVEWLKNQNGNTYDFNGANGTQCPEFVKAYVNWLLSGDPWKDCWNGHDLNNGNEIWTNALWNDLGWEVHYNTLDFMPQPGDIFSAGLSNANHTGIVISSDIYNAKIADANARDNEWSNGDPVLVHDVTWKSANSDTPYGATHYIRPKFASSHKHSYTATITTKPTCTKEGVKTYKCSCGASYIETFRQKGHSIGSWETTVQATCTAKGTKVQKCTVCKQVVNTQTIAAKGHILGNWEVVTQPTYTSTGKEVRKCTVCKKNIEERSIPMKTQATNAPTAPATATPTKKANTASPQNTKVASFTPKWSQTVIPKSTTASTATTQAPEHHTVAPSESTVMPVESTQAPIEATQTENETKQPLVTESEIVETTPKSEEFPVETKAPNENQKQDVNSAVLIVSALASVIVILLVVIIIMKRRANGK